MKKSLAFVIVSLVFVAFTFNRAAFAQGPTPSATAAPVPTPSPTPALVPQPISDASNFWNWLTQNYGALAAIGIVIGLALFAIIFALAQSVASGSLDGVKDRVKDGTKKQIAELENRKMQDTRLRAYLTHSVSEAYSNLDLKSLEEREYDTEVRLREVYIPLRARGTLDEADKHPRKGADEMRLAEAARDSSARAPELTEWIARAPKGRLVVVGRAGSGKSTFLKYVALILADAWLQNNPALVKEKLQITLDPLPVPIYFPLGEFGVFWTKVVKEEERTLQLQGHALLRFLAHNFSLYDLDAPYFANLLKQGQCLIFLDGLDEVKPDLRPAIVQVVEAFVREYASDDAKRPNRYIVACRPEAYRGTPVLSQIQEVAIEPLDQDQVSDFIRRWYREVLRRGDALTAGAEREADDKTRTLLQAIETKPQVRDLTDTPLLLTLIAILHNRHELPDSRVELYDDCTCLLLRDWEKSRPGEQGRQVYREQTPPQVPEELERRREFLQPAAFWLLQAGLPAAPKSDWAREIVARLQLPGDPTEARRRVEIFLEWAVVRCNILDETENEVYGFTHHRTFQEYLAAGYLVSREEDGITTALDLATNRDWWETLRLMAAATRNSKRRSDFLCRVLDRTEPEAILLVGSCLVELRDPYLDPEIANETKQKLIAVMTNAELPAKETRALAGELLGWLGDPREDVSAEIPVVVPVPGGEYWIGSPEGQGYDSERPRHQVTLNDFWISRYPVTNAQYEKFWKAGGYDAERYWTPAGWTWRRGEYKPNLEEVDKKYRESYRTWIEGRKNRSEPYFWRDRRWNIPNHPVVGVTWFEAMAYCAWLMDKLQVSSYKLQVWRNHQLETCDLKPGAYLRLPTEAEWEAAARGKTEKVYPWSNTFDAKLANTSESSIEHTTAVGQYPGGRSPCGALDMSGNVWEWCHSLYKPYRYVASDGREDEKSDAFRVLRGGSWYDDVNYARAAFRFRNYPDSFLNNVGFRFVVSPIGSGF